MDVAAEVFCLDVFGVELESFGNFTDGGCGQFGDFGQYVDGQLCLAELDGLLDFFTQFGFCTADDDSQQVHLGGEQFGACHVNCGDCFFNACFVCTDNGDDGQAEVTCNLDVQVKLCRERVGGQVDAVDDYDVAVCGNLLVGGDCACGNLFGVALSDECECVGHGDCAADLLFSQAEVLTDEACHGVVGDGCAVEDGAEEADAVCALNQGVSQAQGNQGLARVRGRCGEVKTGGHCFYFPSMQCSALGPAATQGCMCSCARVRRAYRSSSILRRCGGGA